MIDPPIYSYGAAVTFARDTGRGPPSFSPDGGLLSFRINTVGDQPTRRPQKF
jgi:hypothetical protein